MRIEFKVVEQDVHDAIKKYLERRQITYSFNFKICYSKDIIRNHCYHCYVFVIVGFNIHNIGNMVAFITKRYLEDII